MDLPLSGLRIGAFFRVSKLFTITAWGLKTGPIFILPPTMTSNVHISHIFFPSLLLTRAQPFAAHMQNVKVKKDLHNTWMLKLSNAALKWPLTHFPCTSSNFAPTKSPKLSSAHTEVLFGDLSISLSREASYCRSGSH